MNIKALNEVCEEIKKLLIEKNKRYGKVNIQKFGEQGVLIRTSDKVERLRTMLFKKVRATEDESVEDTWRDLIGYGIIGLMLRRGKW